MNNNAFLPVPIPENVQCLKEYKKWRKTSSSFHGAIMIGLIELFINCNKTDQLDSMLKVVQQASEDKVKKMKDILEESGKLKLASQRLTHIFDALKLKDQYNLYAQAFFLEYMKRKCGQELDNSELPQFILRQFKVQLIHLPQQTEFEIREKDYIIVYKQEMNYYVVVKEPSPLTFKCSQCKSEKEENLIHKMKCNHHICLACLKKLTINFPQTLRCSAINCPATMSKNEYMTILNNQSAVKSEIRQAENKYICSRCKNRYSEQQLLRLKNCSHLFCKDCLKKAFSVLPKGLGSEKCIESSCNGIFDKASLDTFLYGTQQLEQTKSLIVNKTQIQTAIKQLNTLKEPDAIKCSACFKPYRKESIYVAQCGHEYCKNCCDKEIEREQSKFKCFSSKCQSYVIVDEVQLYFYQKIRSQNISNCANCKEDTKITDAFQSHCGHMICFNCVKIIHDSQRTPICNCGRVIKEEDLEDYCVQQQLIASQSIDTHLEKEFQVNCTFCNSPFTEYNLQQDLLCQKHIIGTCCIIFPLNCPQCEIQSIVIQRDRLRFQLMPQDDEVWKNMPETPKLHS